MKFKFIFRNKIFYKEKYFKDIKKLKRFVSREVSKKELDIILFYIDDQDERILLISKEDFDVMVLTMNHKSFIDVRVYLIGDLIWVNDHLDDSLVRTFYMNRLLQRHENPHKINEKKFAKDLQ